MTAGFTIERLASAHHRQGFSCGVAPLDRYLHELATQDMRRRISHCFVARDPSGAIAGYYTLAASSLPLTDLAEDAKRRLPRYELLPAGLIGRLAVDHRFRGLGLGGAMVIDATRRAAQADPAIYALIVDAKDDSAVEFYRHLGFIRFASRPMSLFLPIATAVAAFRDR